MSYSNLLITAAPARTHLHMQTIQTVLKLRWSITLLMPISFRTKYYSGTAAIIDWYFSNDIISFFYVCDVNIYCNLCNDRILWYATVQLVLWRIFGRIRLKSELITMLKYTPIIYIFRTVCRTAPVYNHWHFTNKYRFTFLIGNPYLSDNWGLYFVRLRNLTYFQTNCYAIFKVHP